MVKNKLNQITHDAKSTKVKQEVVSELANISGYAETNKEKLSLTSGHVPLITSHSLLSAQEIIQSIGSDQSQKTYKLHFMGS